MGYPQSIFVREREWSQNSCKFNQVGGCVHFAVFECTLLWGGGGGGAGWGVFAWNYCKYTFSQNTDDFTVSKNKFTQKRRIYFTFPTKKDMLKINIRNTRTICEICSDLEIKAPDVILVSFLVNFEHNLHLNLLLLLLTLNMYWSIFTPE